MLTGVRRWVVGAYLSETAQKRSKFMTDKQAKLELMEKLEQIAKEIAKGNDVYITKSASGVVIKKMTVGKV